MKTLTLLLALASAAHGCSSSDRSTAVPQPKAAAAPTPTTAAPAPAPTAAPASTPTAAPAPIAPAEPAAPARVPPKMLDLAVPKLTGRIVDEAKLFTLAERRRLTAKLEAHEQATGRQFAVLTYPGLDGHKIEDFSFTVANTWKLGRKEQDDGLLITIARNDRTVRIEVGAGLETAIPNALAARVIEEQLAPAFRKSEYAAGVDAALDQLIAAASPAK